MKEEDGGSRWGEGQPIKIFFDLMEDFDAEFRKEPCSIEESKTTGSTGYVGYSQVLWLHKKWSSCDSTWNLAVMGGSHPCDGTKAITEQGCSFISLRQSMGLPFLLLLQTGDSDTKNSEDSCWDDFKGVCLLHLCHLFYLRLPSMVCLLLNSCYSQFRLATSKTTTAFGLY